MKKYNLILYIALIVLIPVYFLLEWFGIVFEEEISSAEIIIMFSALVEVVFISADALKTKTISKFLIFIILYCLFFGINAFVCSNPSLAFEGNVFTKEGVFINIAYLILLYGITLLSDNDKRKIYYALTFVAVMESVIGVLQAVFKIPFWCGYSDESVMRAFGTLMNPNPYGAFMVMFAMLECALLILVDNKQRIMHTVLALVYSFSVFMSGTRAAILGLLVSGLILTGYCVFVKQKKRVLIWIAIIVLAGGLVLSLSNSDVIKDIFIRTSNDAGNVSQNIGAVGSGRVWIWRESLNVFLEHPIIGVGVSNLKIVSVRDYNMSVVYVAHNEFLDILATQGIIGLLFYMVLIGWIIHSAAVAIANKHINTNSIVSVLMCVIAYLITSVFGWRIVYLTPYFYVFLGLLYCKEDKANIAKE